MAFSGLSSFADTNTKDPTQPLPCLEHLDPKALPLATHDTSRIGWHMRDLEALAKNVEAAVSSSFPNHGGSRYRSVTVGMMRWEHDTLGVESEFNKLGDVLEKQYGFHVENLIIRANERSHNLLMSQALGFIDDFDAKENLFILYYAGHGYINAHRQSTWVFSQEAESPTVDWSHIQGLFERGKSDVLIILDCCAAASAAATVAPRQGNAYMETIAACGFEGRAPPPGEHSFTTSLIEVLEDWNNVPSFSIAMLYSEVFRVVMQRRKEKCSNGKRLEWRSTPVHISNCKHPREIPIELCKRSLIDVADYSRSRSAKSIDDLLSDSNYVAPTTYLDLMSLSCEALEERLNTEIIRGRSPDTDSTNPNSPEEEPPECTQTLKVPHMLISVELDQDQKLPSSEACRRWISSFPGLAKHVTVDGVYQGYSTVLILSIPIVIWNTLPNHPACRPITYVTSRNLLQDTLTRYGRRRASMATPDSVGTPTTLSDSSHNSLNKEHGTPIGMDISAPERGPQDSDPFLDSAVADDAVSQSTSAAKRRKSTTIGYIMSNVTDDVSSRRGRLILHEDQKAKLADRPPRAGHGEQLQVQPLENLDKPHPPMTVESDDQSYHMSARDLAKNVFPTDQSMNLPPPPTRDFEPCAATSSMFLYAQGNSVVCAHHHTLTIERRFSRHTEEIRLLAVDIVSERGAGHLVVSYDAAQTAIVWDCTTGDELARFVSYENLTVAAWMRNGNVAFGNAQGNVILFDPTTSEHISTRTIDQIPITALAPAADCRTYALGFSNGSLLIAALQPRFTILHNLTTSRGPSPIVTLAWHTSSTRQKSDMLATQTNDGDLRVWSIAKSPTNADTAKLVRVLKRTENYPTGPNWLGWAKNGRIVQFSGGETSSWDVRTKQVTYEAVPTLDHVRGLAVYGPGATLFTLGRSNSLQQFDLNSPPQLVSNVQHPANLLPPSPPASIEEQKKQDAMAAIASVDSSSLPINVDLSESDEDHMSPLARIIREVDKLEQERRDIDRAVTLSPASSRSHTLITSRSSTGVRQYREHQKHSSAVSGGLSDGTTMIGSSVHSITREPSPSSSRNSLSMSSLSFQPNASTTSRPRGSHLRRDVLRSPDDAKVVDLFKFTKTRLRDIPYRHPQVLHNTQLTNHDLRRQMFSTIFGWNGDAEALIQDEMNRHPLGSPTRLLLAKWLGDIDTDIMASSHESLTSSDWMLLALSGIGGHASQTKVPRAYAQVLLERGDVHTAATIMIGIRDQNDAIEIYVSHKRYMEALILTCLVFPADWHRQAELIRKWGEWAVQHSQRQLAIRCFSCMGLESLEPWISPTAQVATFAKLQGQSIPELLSLPLSLPGAGGPQRGIAKTSALKLITSFGDESRKSKFFGFVEDDGGVTPVAESALSPAGSSTAHTAFLRPGDRSAYHTPQSPRTATPGGFTGQRPPSIGEMPTDVVPRRKLEPAKLPTPSTLGPTRRRMSV